MLLIFLLSCAAINGQGTLRESLAFYSVLLEDTVRYSVYLPEGYHTSTRDYPVLYLLHGAWGHETD